MACPTSTPVGQPLNRIRPTFSSRTLHQRASLLGVGVGGVHGGGELTLESLQVGEQTRGVVVPDDDT